MSTKVPPEVRRCGFCGTGQHQHCVVETPPWYGRTWKCECECDKANVTKPEIQKRDDLPKLPTMTPRRRPRVEEDEPAINTRRRRRNAKVDAVAQSELDKVLDSDEVKEAVRKVKEAV